VVSAQSPTGIAQVGDIIAGKFRVERVLGEGGMGLVLEATHLMLDERVALKFLRPQVMLQPDVVARFAQEARAAAKLKSEHVARVLDVGEDRSMPYIVMEYLEGRNLEQILAEDGRLAIDQAVELLVQAAEGISEAHARGIIHRDLKPANLFLTQRKDGWATLKILDFGISKAALSNAGDVPAGPGKTVSLLGSPYYMSPEQLRSTRDVDRRTDLWSLGAVLFELLTARTPFDATEFIALVNDILEKPHTPLRQLRPDAPPELEALVDRALAKDPAQRFQSAGELALALLPFTTSKRSRVIATHAITLTRSSGIDPNLPLPSALPPTGSSGALPVAIPASGSVPTVSLDGTEVPRESVKRRIIESLNETTASAAEVPQRSAEPGGTSRMPAFALVGLLVVGAGVFFATRSTPPAPKPAEAAQAAQAAQAAPPVQADPRPAATGTAAPTTTAATEPATSATAAATAAASASAAASAAAAASAKAPVVVKRPVTGTSAPVAASAAPAGDLEIRRER
jgi:eukaryotic-like serine/threonine-protein kinase